MNTTRSRTTTAASRRRANDPMPFSQKASLYLAGTAPRALLSREREAELGHAVEEGERAMLRALVASKDALAALGDVGRELREGRAHARDLLRNADDDVGRDESDQRLAEVLERAATLARGARETGRVNARARRRLHEDLERVRLHRRVLDRAAGALPEGCEALAAGRKIADDAKAELVRGNLGLVMSMAKRNFGHGLPLHDLVQEGNIGLMRAVDKFDHRRGLRFGTYAAWWIRQQMTRAILDQASTIRVPVHLAEYRRKVRRVQRAFEQVHGRAPSEAELGQQSGLLPEKVRSALSLTPEPVSLEAPVGKDQEASLGDFVADGGTPPPDEQVARERMHEQIKRLLDRLTPRERDILQRRFGIDDAPEQTLAEIGASLSLSRERVRQIEAEALRKLRVPSQAGGLDTYLAA